MAIVNTSDPFLQQGVLTLKGRFSTYLGSDLENDGIIEGGGRILSNVSNSGEMNPGLPLGFLDVEGDFTQHDEGTFNVELAGTDNSDPANVQHDVLNVLGIASLSGTLNVFLANDAGVDGDTNGDDLVDIDDLNSVRNNFGTSGMDVAGDANGDLVVDLDDLNLVRNNFGSTADAFLPELGDTFEILTASGGIQDVFNEVNLPQLADGLAFVVDYQPNQVQLRVASAATLPVPEPSAIAICICSLALVSLSVRGRRAG